MNILSSVLLTLYSGYLTKLSCSGRLLAASSGNNKMVQVEALPKELGCGVLLKPFASEGRTNLFLESSSGSYQLILEINSTHKPSARQLQATLPVNLKGVQR